MLHRLAHERPELQHVLLEDRPSVTDAPDGPSRAVNSAQIRSSDQSSTLVSGSHWKYSRCTLGDRVDTSTNPRSECA